MVITRLQYLLQSFVFFAASFLGDFQFSIDVGTLGNFGIMSPLNYNPMSVEMALNIPTQFIIFLSVFILFPHWVWLSRTLCPSHFGVILLAVHQSTDYGRPAHESCDKKVAAEPVKDTSVQDWDLWSPMMTWGPSENGPEKLRHHLISNFPPSIIC